MTLVHQGGPMSSLEVQEFEVHPLKDVIIHMRKWDENAKDPEMYLNEGERDNALNYIQQLLEQQLTLSRRN